MRPLGRRASPKPCGRATVQVRPPAIVTEFMSLGSLRSALSRRAEAVQHPVTRLLIALDAAKVDAPPIRACPAGP